MFWHQAFSAVHPTYWRFKAGERLTILLFDLLKALSIERSPGPYGQYLLSLLIVNQRIAAIMPTRHSNPITKGISALSQIIEGHTLHSVNGRDVLVYLKATEFEADKDNLNWSPRESPPAHEALKNHPRRFRNEEQLSASASQSTNRDARRVDLRFLRSNSRGIHLGISGPSTS